MEDRKERRRERRRRKRLGDFRSQCFDLGESDSIKKL